MECQREAGVPRRVRLTDQALVAVAIARDASAAQDRPATSADLLIGLATESEGWAGHLLRRTERAVVRLAERGASLPPGLAPMDVVIADAADRAAPRPPSTFDLLRSALIVGGEDIDDLLSACGVDMAALWPEPPPGDPVADLWAAADESPWTPTSETVTLADPGGPVLSVSAARAVGRTRAAAGGAVDLVLAVATAAEGDARAPLQGVEGMQLAAARADLERHDPAASGDDWDLGLEAVLAAAAVLARERQVTTGDLVHAALVAGGAGPITVLETARAAAERGDHGEERG
jgi:hypothetical protein